MITAAETLAPMVGLKPACAALDVPRATVYRQRRPRWESVSRPKPPRSLSTSERERVLLTLNSDSYLDKAPAQAYNDLLDAGIYLCSVRTMYRILAANRQVRERRNILRHPQYERPELIATAPNRVWSWDITKLRGPVKWSYYHLYVLLDIFSRYVVGWLVAESERAGLAKRLITDSYEKQGITSGQLSVHADRGTSMMAKTTGQLLAGLGITESHSRPRVSDDNPFSEAQFKTIKYRPEFPARFGSLRHAESVCRELFTWYNTQHRHSSLAYLTPKDVHYGHAQTILGHRQQVLDQAHASNPERFVSRPPQVPTLPDTVWINPPEKGDGSPVVAQ